MKRTLSVTLVMGGLLLVAFTFLLARQQRLLVAEEAQAVEERARVLSEAPPPVSVPGESGGSGAASPPRISGGTDSQFSDFDEQPANTPEPKALPDPEASQKVTQDDLKRADPVVQLLKKLHPNMSLEVLQVGEAVLLRGHVASDVIHRQVVRIAEEFYPKVVAELEVQPPQLLGENFANAEATPPILIGDDKHGLRAMLAKLYPTAKLEVNVLTGDLVLIRGRVAKAAHIKPITQIAEQFVPRVLNYLTADDRPPATAPLATNPTAGNRTTGLGAVSGGTGLGAVGGGTGRVNRLPMTNATPRDDQDAAMDREAKQLAARVRAAKEPEKSKLRAELEKLTEKHFEHRQQRRNAEIADMADRVDKLRVAHHQRQEDKPDILKRRLADLLDEENELKWDEARLKQTTQVTQPLARPTMDPQLPNLDGEWLVTLPAGFEFVGKIEKRPEGCWSFLEMRNLSGYYQIEGTTLKAVTTDPKKPLEYEWLILNDKVLVLTKAPQKDGHDYRGATLRRGAKPKTTGVGPQHPADPVAVNNTLWSRMGFKLTPLEPGEKLPSGTKGYQGGMRITDVRAESPAAQSGLRQGDLLVGLHVWETLSFENVKFAIEHPVLESAASIKFFVLRDSDTLTGSVVWKANEVNSFPPTIDGEQKEAAAKVTDALIRVAEARRKLAEFELAKAVESNRKVPGTIPGSEIERFKANLEIANAELDAAKAGVDISRPSPPKDNKNAEPTYNNVVLTEWLRRLENERNPGKLAEAVLAMNSLASDTEPHQLVRATLRMMQAYVTQQGDATNSKIFYGSVGLLCLAKSDVVFDELIAELDAAPTKKLSLHFRIVVAELLQSLVRRPDGLSFPSNYPVPSVSKDTVQSLRMALRRNSPRLVTALVAAAQRDPALSDWLVGCSADLLTICEQPLSDYSELIPHVERALAVANSGLRPTAARLLGSSKLRVSEIMTVAESWLSSTEFALVTQGGATRMEPAFEIGVETLVTIAPHSPQAVTRLTETLRDHWARFAEYSDKPDTKSAKTQREDINCKILVEALGRIGELAHGAIPLLREIEQAPASETVVRDNTGAGGFGALGGAGFGGTPDRKSKTLRQLVTATIQKIENAQLQPNTGSQPAGNRN